MASKHQILCINKIDRPNPNESITHIGGKNSVGTRWSLPQKEAIVRIEKGAWEFFVNVSGQIVNVVISVSRFENKYLKTVSDGEFPNNLLNLPEFN